MSLHLLELELTWPTDVSLLNLRNWLMRELLDYGEPLRWSITNIERNSTRSGDHKLSLEVVIIKTNG